MMMSAEGNLRVLPTDLILKIFLRLPSKCIAICRCVSKLWSSLIESPDFAQLFLTRSATQQRLLFTVLRGNDDLCLYSCPQPQISDKNSESSLSVTAEFHMSLPKYNSYATSEMSPSVSGLIYSPSIKVLCNPSTRHLLRLPHPPSSVMRSFFGYDPIDKQFSVLAICKSVSPALPFSYQILKLGSGNLSWRSLDCPVHHLPLQINVCINGILYYCSRKIACFDLNSEELKLMDQPWSHKPKLLVNFKGKLGGINIECKKEMYNVELSLWVLEDVEKQEWSEHVYNLPYNFLPYRILGVTGKSDIVLAWPYTTHPFYVYFFNPDKNSLQKVEIKGFEELIENHYFFGCVDYVEELRVLKWT